MISRAALLVACWVFACPARAELPPPPERAEVVMVCTQSTVLPEGEVADPPTILAYCTCAIGEVANALTPAEFDLFAIATVARFRGLPLPSEEEVTGIDLPAFRARNAEAVLRTRQRCNPIIFERRE